MTTDSGDASARDALLALADAQIAKQWPVEWARANDPSLSRRSKARNKLRQSFRHFTEYQVARAQVPNARCDNCTNHFKRTHSNDLACALDSDFYGDLIVKPESFCARHSDAAALRARANMENEDG